MVSFLLQNFSTFFKCIFLKNYLHKMIHIYVCTSRVVPIDYKSTYFMVSNKIMRNMITTVSSVINCNVLMSKSGFVFVQVSVSYDDGPGEITGPQKAEPEPKLLNWVLIWSPGKSIECRPASDSPSLDGSIRGQPLTSVVSTAPPASDNLTVQLSVLQSLTTLRLTHLCGWGC